MKVYLVGIGTDGRKTLTAEAARAIDEAQLLIGAERMLAPFADSGKRTVCEYRPRETAEILNSSGVDTAAVLLSGDTGFFSGAAKLRSVLAGHEVEAVCGISSAAYLCAKAGASYEDMRFISLHGRSGNIAVNVKMNERCFFLLGGDTGAKDVCRRLCEYGLADVSVHIGERLGYPDERITSGTARELCGAETDRLCAMIVVNPNCLRHVPSAISDDSFTRTEIPMTKAAVRGNIVAGLDIGRGDICWDIGCGTGSVSVEMAYRCPDGRVYSFDKKPGAVSLTAENARKFGCDNIIALEAELPALPEGTPKPDKVFIGGSSGSIEDIVSLIYGLNPLADITAAAVTVETLARAAEAFEKFGGCTITQLAVTDTRRVGGYTMFSAQNPVFIIRGRRA